MIKTMKSIDEAFSLLPSKMDSKEARLMLLAIGFQLFDAAVNRGIGNAVRFLQRA